MRELPKADGEGEGAGGHTGCPHDGEADGEAVSTTLLHLGAPSWCILGTPLCAAAQGHGLWGPPALEAGTAGPQLAAPAAHRPETLSGVRGGEVLSFFLPTTSLRFLFWRQGLKGSGPVPGKIERG